MGRGRGGCFCSFAALCGGEHWGQRGICPPAPLSLHRYTTATLPVALARFVPRDTNGGDRTDGGGEEGGGGEEALQAPVPPRRQRRDCGDPSARTGEGEGEGAWVSQTFLFPYSPERCMEWVVQTIGDRSAGGPGGAHGSLNP